MRKTRLLILLSLVSLSSCGIKIDDIVDGDIYNSPIFVKNIYSKKAVSLENAKEGITAILNDNDLVITSYSDLKKLDPQAALSYPNTTEYGHNMNMSSRDSSFKYDYISKLFDGRCFCEGKYQLSRVQIVSSGFSNKFYKEGTGVNSLTYFASSFRATTDNTIECYKTNGQKFIPKVSYDGELVHTSKIEVYVDIYNRGEDGLIYKNRFIVPNLTFLNGTNDGGHYKFLGFSFKNYLNYISRVTGFGISFKVLEDPLVDINNKNGIDISYSLMLYECFIPGLSWN